MARRLFTADNMPHFKGEEGENFVDFIDTFEAYATSCALTDEEKEAYLSLALQGNAKILFKFIRKQNAHWNYEQIVTKLGETWTTHKDAGEVRRVLYTMPRKKHEHLRDFMFRMMTVIAESDEVVSQAEIRRIIVERMVKELPESIFYTIKDGSHLMTPPDILSTAEKMISNSPNEEEHRKYLQGAYVQDSPVEATIVKNVKGEDNSGKKLREMWEEWEKKKPDPPVKQEKKEDDVLKTLTEQIQNLSINLAELQKKESRHQKDSATNAPRQGRQAGQMHFQNWQGAQQMGPRGPAPQEWSQMGPAPQQYPQPPLQQWTNMNPHPQQFAYMNPHPQQWANMGPQTQQWTNSPQPPQGMSQPWGNMGPQGGMPNQGNQERERKRKVKEDYKEADFLIEINGSLPFKSRKNLVQAVSADFKLSAGIAREFRKHFGKPQNLSIDGKGVGDVAVVKDKKRHIFYLITKPKYFQKPNPLHLKWTLIQLRRTCMEENIKSLCMPRISCGLDGLFWHETVKPLLIQVFKDSGIKIEVYTPTKREQRIRNSNLIEVAIRKVEKDFNRGYRNDVLRRFGSLENYRKIASRRNYVPTEIEIRAWAEHFFLAIPVVTSRGRFVVGCKYTATTEEISLEERVEHKEEIQREEIEKEAYATIPEEREDRRVKTENEKEKEERKEKNDKKEENPESQEKKTYPTAEVGSKKNAGVVLTAKSHQKSTKMGERQKVDPEALFRKEFEIDSTETVMACFQETDPQIQKWMNEPNGYERYFMEVGTEANRPPMQVNVYHHTLQAHFYATPSHCIISSRICNFSKRDFEGYLVFPDKRFKKILGQTNIKLWTPGPKIFLRVLIADIPEDLIVNDDFIQQYNLYLEEGLEPLPSLKTLWVHKIKGPDSNLFSVAMELDGEERRVTVDSAASKFLVSVKLIDKQKINPCGYEIMAADDQQIKLLGEIQLKLSAEGEEWEQTFLRKPRAVHIGHVSIVSRDTAVLSIPGTAAAAAAAVSPSSLGRYDCDAVCNLMAHSRSVHLNEMQTNELVKERREE
ncbi:hypothetical protein FOCC_FOCC016339, partial [Frankliniella occidentalis]